MNKFTGLTKQFTAMLLASMLVIGSVPRAVFAADAQEKLGQTSEVAREVLTEDTPEELANAGETPVESYSKEASADEAEIEYYTVILDANGGYFENEWDDTVGDYVEHAVTVTRHIPVGGTISLCPLYESETDSQTMTFSGWSLAPGEELVSQAEEEYIPVNNCFLYAVWEADDSINFADSKEDVSWEEFAEIDNQDTDYVDESTDQTDISPESEDNETVEESGVDQENENTNVSEESETDTIQEGGDTESAEESGTGSEVTESAGESRTGSEVAEPVEAFETDLPQESGEGGTEEISEETNQEKQQCKNRLSDPEGRH